MGFYSPATLLQDAKRGGRDLQANPPCVQHSQWKCTVEGDRQIRIGLRYVKGLHETAVTAMLAARAEKPFASMDDFLRRTDFTVAERRVLAAVGAFAALTAERRAALWQIEAAWSDQEALFKHYCRSGFTPDTAPNLSGMNPDLQNADDASPLAPMSRREELQADFGVLGLTTGAHPMALLRSRLPDVCPAEALKCTPNGQRVTIAGSVICRQRPGTAKGFVFVSLEDETGIANAVVVPALFERLRLTITQEPALKITGRLQNVAGVQHVKAELIEPLREAELPAQVSYDFH